MGMGVITKDWLWYTAYQKCQFWSVLDEVKDIITYFSELSILINTDWTVLNYSTTHTELHILICLSILTIKNLQNPYAHFMLEMEGCLM